MKEHIEKIKDKFSLTREEIEMVMQQIMSGEASKNEVAEFLLALRAKGPTIDEITGAAKIMRKFVVGIDIIVCFIKNLDGIGSCPGREV